MRTVLIVVGVLLAVGLVGSLLRDEEPDESPAAETTPTPEASVAQSEAESPESQAPTPVPTPVPTPPPAFADIPLSGAGDAVPTFTIPEDEAAIAQVTHVGSSNFAIFSIAADGSNNDLLVNTIGNYSGTVLFDEDSGVHSVAFEVTADGPWTILIRPITAARPWSPSGALNGSGDDVVLVSPPTTGLQTATLQHTGSSNFAVFAYTETGAELLVNEIGNYLGEVLLPSGTLLLEITADGPWTVAPQ